MASYLKARGLSPAQIKRYVRQLENARTALPHGSVMETVERGESLSFIDHPDLAPDLLNADIAWHLRGWARWVLREARKDLARYYPVYAEYCALKPYRRVELDTSEPLKLVPVDDAGAPQVELLNTGFDAAYLDNPANPRWVAKPTVAYLWARTVHCKACRAEVPLLKTRWLAKSDKKRVVLTMRPREDKRGLDFGIDQDVKVQGGNAAQKREYDKRLGAGTMSRAGVTCPCCGTIMTMEDLRLEGRAGRMGAVMTAVVTESPSTKEYRRPTDLETSMAKNAASELDQLYSQVPFGLPTEPTPKGGSGASRAFSVDGYGIDQWQKLFLPRQLYGLGRILLATRSASVAAAKCYPSDWAEALAAYLAAGLSRLLDAARLDAVVITSQDEYVTEYLPRSNNPRYAVSGFDGSAGCGIFLSAATAQALDLPPFVLFVDGRYHFQADQQCDPARVRVEKLGMNVTIWQALADWLLAHASRLARVGYDARRISVGQRNRLFEQT
jgi:hypothetical protein